MKTGRIALISALSLASAGAMFACSKPASPSSDLSRDLDAASATPALTLAPTSGRRDIVSAEEQSPNARKAPAPSRRQPVPRVAAVTPPPAPVVTKAVTPPPATTVAAVPQEPAPMNDNAAQSRRPMPVQQQHQGRYKTEAEVFRDAPFPITP